MKAAFEGFRRAFLPDPISGVPVDRAAMASYCETALGTPVPILLQEFWEEFGFGYFGEKMIYFFGDGLSSAPRDSLQEWNNKDFWQGIRSVPAQRGLVFFAETCFGDQIGFRWENGVVKFLLFCVDTFEIFSIAEGDDAFFGMIMSDRYALVDDDRYDEVRKMLGPLRDGMHYAPFVSPMLGCSGSANNFAFETPNVHFRTAVATRSAIGGEPQ